MLCDKVYRLRMDREWVKPEYMELVLNSPPLLADIEKRKSGISDSGLNLTQQGFLEMPVPLCPTQEQGRIAMTLASYFSVADATSQSSISSLRRIGRLRQSILKWAFEGKLVDQDSNDEPASVLLERIKSEREAALAEAKKNGKPTRAKKTTRRKKSK